MYTLNCHISAEGIALVAGGKIASLHRMWYFCNSLVCGWVACGD